MTRARTTRPGTVRFVGGGPGNAGMLTCRAQEVLTGNPLVFADADVSADVLALVATEVPVPQELLDARRAEIVADYEAELLNPYQAAELGYVDAVVPPHATRGQLIRALRATLHKREARPAKKHGNMPL